MLWSPNAAVGYPFGGSPPAGAEFTACDTNRDGVINENDG